MVIRGGVGALFAIVGVSYWVITLVALTLVNGEGYDSLTQPGSELALGPVVHTEMGSGTRPSVLNAFGLGAFILTMAVMFAAARAFGARPVAAVGRSDARLDDHRAWDVSSGSADG